jgi:hypothetical protein
VVALVPMSREPRAVGATTLVEVAVRRVAVVVGCPCRGSRRRIHRRRRTETHRGSRQGERCRSRCSPSRRGRGAAMALPEPGACRGRKHTPAVPKPSTRRRIRGRGAATELARLGNASGTKASTGVASTGRAKNGTSRNNFTPC